MKILKEVKEVSMEKCPYCNGEMEITYCNEYIGNDGYIHGGIEYECKECDAIVCYDYDNEMD